MAAPVERRDVIATVVAIVVFAAGLIVALAVPHHAPSLDFADTGLSVVAALAALVERIVAAITYLIRRVRRSNRTPAAAQWGIASGVALLLSSTTGYYLFGAIGTGPRAVLTGLGVGSVAYVVHQAVVLIECRQGQCRRGDRGAPDEQPTPWSLTR